MGRWMATARRLRGGVSKAALKRTQSKTLVGRWAVGVIRDGGGTFGLRAEQSRLYTGGDRWRSGLARFSVVGFSLGAGSRI
jgi:hypothetical protein